MLTSVTLFNLVSTNHSNAHFIIQTDDDVYVNIHGLLRTMFTHGSSLKSSVVGICTMDSLRDTNPSSKWYVISWRIPLLALSWDKN